MTVNIFCFLLAGTPALLVGTGLTMGYSSEHTARIRREILEHAGRLFRKHGYGGVSIDQIMQAAGLTRGGFYAHFKSKEELFTRTLESELDFTNQLRRCARLAPENPTAASLKAIDYYLNPDNREQVGPGCTMVASSVDLSRASKAARKAYTKTFENLLEEFQSLVAEDLRAADASRERALAAIATCVGAVSLARSLADDALAADLLKACRATVRAGLGHADQ